MTAIALVAVGTLAFWLVMVYRADRQPRTSAAGLSREPKGAAAPGLSSEELATSDEERRRAQASGGERDKQSDERRGKTADSGAPGTTGTGKAA